MRKRIPMVAVLLSLMFSLFLLLSSSSIYIESWWNVIASGLLLWILAIIVTIPFIYFICYIFWRCPSCHQSWVWTLVNTDILTRKYYKFSAANSDWLIFSFLRCIDDYSCYECDFKKKQKSFWYKIDRIRLPFFN